MSCTKGEPESMTLPEHIIDRLACIIAATVVSSPTATYLESWERLPPEIKNIYLRCAVAQVEWLTSEHLLVPRDAQ